MFARLVLSVWAGSGQFIAPSGPESREHRGQVSLSSPVSLRRPGPGHPPLKLPRLAPTVADWTRGAARRGAITKHFSNDELNIRQCITATHWSANIEILLESLFLYPLINCICKHKKTETESKFWV